MPGTSNALRAEARAWSSFKKGTSCSRSAFAGFLLLGRLGALLRRPGRALGRDAGRLAGAGRGRHARLRSRPEERTALRRELRLLLDHAGGDVRYVREAVAAQPHLFRGAGLPALLGGE